MKRTNELVFQDFNCLLVVTSDGRMRQLFTPFLVHCIRDGLIIPVGVGVYVDAVVLHPRYRLCYWIHQRWYPYFFFRI